MITGIGIVVDLFVIGAIVYAVSPKFRTTVQVWFGKANNSATTPLERQKNEYEHLVKAVESQIGNVASAKAGAVQAEQDVTAAQAEVAKLKKQYADFKGKASEEAINGILTKLNRAQTALTTAQSTAEASHQAAELATKALDTAREQLQDAASTLQSNEQKAAVTAVLNSAAKVSEDLKGVTSRLGSFNEANRQVDKEYLAAQERLKMGQGTSADQEIANLEKQSSIDATRAALDAELAGNADKK